MKFKILSACAVCAMVLCAATASFAQTKVSMSGTCAKPDVMQSVPAGDKDGHTFSISQGKCTVKGEVGGVEGKEGVWADHGDGTATRGKVSGIFTETFANGDKIIYTYSETTMMKDGAPVSATNSYQVSSGTGRMKGIKGTGTCKLTPTGTDGAMNFTCSGTYTMGAAQ
jgi:hypothetical protein